MNPELTPALPPSTHLTLIMKDRAFDRELDDLGQPLEEVEAQAEAWRPSPAERQAADPVRH